MHNEKLIPTLRSVPLNYGFLPVAGFGKWLIFPITKSYHDADTKFSCIQYAFLRQKRLQFSKPSMGQESIPI